MNILNTLHSIRCQCQDLRRVVEKEPMPGRWHLATHLAACEQEITQGIGLAVASDDQGETVAESNEVWTCLRCGVVTSTEKMKGRHCPGCGSYNISQGDD